MRQLSWVSAGLLALGLSACGGGGSNNTLPLDSFNQPVGDAPASPNGARQDTAQTAPASDATSAAGTLISADNAALLTRSTLDILAKLIGVSRFVTAMVGDGAPLIVVDNARSGTIVAASACQGSGRNRVTFAIFQPGHFLPPGKNLNAALDHCLSGEDEMSGFMDLSAIQVTGDPAGTGDWRVSGVLSFSGLAFHNGDGTETLFTNKLDFSVEQATGVLTTTLNIATMNAEHVLDAQTHVNYLLEPFYLRTVSDANAGSYRIVIGPPPAAAASILNRYTTRAEPDGQGGTLWRSIGDDIELVVNTQADPLAWNIPQPDLRREVPVAGVVRLSDRTGSHRIDATVDGGGNGVVILHIDSGSAVTSQFADWQTLLTTPRGTL